MLDKFITITKTCYIVPYTENFPYNQWGDGEIRGWSKWITFLLALNFLISNSVQARNYKGEGGERSPLPFFKNWKKWPNFGKNALIVTIYGLNFSFKIEFLRASKKKKWRFAPAGPLFLVL